MLGTAGTVGAEIFVLTGHAAAISGPASILALLIGGLVTYSIAINYCELGTAFPVTGGAMTYVREAFGNNILSFLVGSMDCLSSVFYAALSAVGFAWSLSIFIPAVASMIVPVAVCVLVFFTIMNVLGVTKVGNIQVGLGIILLAVLIFYAITGLASPEGFKWETFMPEGKFFIGSGGAENFLRILRTVALIYMAFIGFEVIADDAEEIKNPNRNLPLGILISLSLVLVINVVVSLSALGNVPYTQLASSSTALTDAVEGFLPGIGVPLMGIAGLIATLTSINAGLLSATREAFTLSRDRVWPVFLSRINRFRTPHFSILCIGGVACLVAMAGEVNFLSYISASGYLFVIFCATLAMILLRRKFPDLHRPFKAPLFPITAYIAIGFCLIVIAFTEVKALVFGLCVLGGFSLFYYGRKHLQRWVAARKLYWAGTEQRILVPLANPATAVDLIKIAGMIAKASQNTTLCAFTVLTPPAKLSPEMTERLLIQKRVEQRKALDRVIQSIDEYELPFFPKVSIAHSVVEGIMNEIKNHAGTKLVLTGWPGKMDSGSLKNNVVNELLISARTNVAVFLDRGFQLSSSILVPVGHNPHARLATRLALELALSTKCPIRFLHIVPTGLDVDDFEDELLQLKESIEREMGTLPVDMIFSVTQSGSVLEGILSETRKNTYDLLVMGTSDEWERRDRLFGEIDDRVILNVPCSVLIARRFEPTSIAWVRRQLDMLDSSNEKKGV